LAAHVKGHLFGNSRKPWVAILPHLFDVSIDIEKQVIAKKLIVFELVVDW